MNKQAMCLRLLDATFAPNRQDHFHVLVLFARFDSANKRNHATMCLIEWKAASSSVGAITSVLV